MKGWAIEGIIPFNRRTLWRKRGAPKPTDAELSNFSWPSSSSLRNTSSSGVGPTMPSAGGDVVASSEQDEPQQSTRPMPDNVRDALNFMKNVSMPSGSLAVNDIISNHLRLINACQVHATWANIPAVFDEVATGRDRRITSRNIFGLPGSATEEEAMARLRAREEEKQAADAAAAAKKEAADAKKARDTTARVLLGSELLDKIKQGGPQVLRKLKIDELHALLINAYPQNSIPRPNKKEGLEKVEELATVQDALRIFASARIPAPLLP